MKRRTFFASLFAPLLAPFGVKKAAAAPVTVLLWTDVIKYSQKQQDSIRGSNSADQEKAEIWGKWLKQVGYVNPPYGAAHDPFAKLDVSKNRETIYFHSQPPREAPATMGL